MTSQFVGHVKYVDDASRITSLDVKFVAQDNKIKVELFFDFCFTNSCNI